MSGETLLNSTADAASGGNTNGIAAAGRERCGVRLYEDADLVPLDVPHQGTVSRLVRDLLAAGSSRQRQQILRDEMEEIGFNWMGYHTVRRSAAGALHRTSITTYSPPGWVKHYFDQHYDEVDLRQRPSANSILPAIWDAESLSEQIESRPCCARSRRFVKDLREHGICSGISFQVSSAGAGSGDRIIISLASDLANRRWMGDQTLGDALVLCLSFHDYMAQHVVLPEADPVPQDHAGADVPKGLPPLQAAVLGHVVNGLTDHQIAKQLNVSSHTVDYHLRKLRQRFAARNRVQLVNAASSLMEASQQA
ncbi:LuxR family transcriptional regulator [Ramlibacter sp.]|uniref:helix-turn-helix transcriptional regulator n=1 Tax=Ramlibacter sp. TaxID=1917967 RepID=UPI0017D839CE|nr:LuxR family transcriptional regulator [Ramlibacter sp.]MBA2673267.1 LuxR family transcriptional regulator [Ramlibacter sp.]